MRRYLDGVLTFRDHAGLAHTSWNTVTTFSSWYFFTPKWRVAAVRPAVEARAVVCGVDHHRVVSDAHFVEQVQKLPDLAAMFRRAVGITTFARHA
jgi:hypothetical protein